MQNFRIMKERERKLEEFRERKGWIEGERKG